MGLARYIRLIWTFYKKFFVLSVIIDICGVAIFWKYGYSTFSPLLFLKLITLGITFYGLNAYKYKEYYYYQNLGMSIKLLWTILLSFDLLLFILLITQLYKFK